MTSTHMPPTVSWDRWTESDAMAEKARKPLAIVVKNKSSERTAVQVDKVCPAMTESDDLTKKLSLNDLDPNDKLRIAKLIRELARVSKEKEEMESQLGEERRRYEDEIRYLLEQQDHILHDKEKLLKQCSDLQTALIRYRMKMKALKRKVDDKAKCLPAEEDVKTTTAFQTPRQVQREMTSTPKASFRHSFGTSPPQSDHAQAQSIACNPSAAAPSAPPSHLLDVETQTTVCKSPSQTAPAPQEEASFSQLYRQMSQAERKDHLLQQREILRDEQRRLQVQLAQQERVLKMKQSTAALEPMHLLLPHHLQAKQVRLLPRAEMASDGEGEEPSLPSPLICVVPRVRDRKEARSQRELLLQSQDETGAHKRDGTAGSDLTAEESRLLQDVFFLR